MRKLFSTSQVHGQDVHATYDTDKAQLKLIGPTNKVMILAEDEVDNLLRVVEYANDPREDLAEYFGECGMHLGRYAAACLIVDNARELAKLVYDDVS
jgi:hypothetical protein